MKQCFFCVKRKKSRTAFQFIAKPICAPIDKILTYLLFYDIILKKEVMNRLSKVRLVLCDDNNADLSALRKSADEYIKQRGFDGETVCFSDPEEVLRYSENGGESVAAVYMLDVIMPGLDGINLGRKIRERDKNSAVIYISSSREYAPDAFSVRAFSYLIKPYSKEKLFSELDECLSRIEAVPQKLSVKTADSTIMLAMSDIFAVEYFDHRLIFHLSDGGKIESSHRRQPFDVQAEKIIQTGAFLKVSASCLVNYHNIQEAKADGFIMRDGSKYKITRKYADARKKYIDYELDGGVLL